MKFTKRQVEILQYLNEYRDTTVKQIAQKVGVTSQTIKAELSALEEVLSMHHITLELQSGKGIKISGGSQLTKLLKVCQTNLEFAVQDQILLLLVLNREYLVLQDIADTLFISKSQVEKIMPGIIKQYGKDIQSVRHHGYLYKGTEINRRNIFTSLIAPYMRGAHIRRRFEEFHETHFPIKRYFEDVLIDQSLKVLEYIMQLKEFRFVDAALQQLFLYVLFSLKSNKQEVAVMGEAFLAGIQMMSDFNIYITQIDEVNRVLELDLNEEEKNYLAYLLMILKKKKVTNEEEVLLEMSTFSKEILERIKEKLYIDLTGDDHLIHGLSHHIYSTIRSQTIGRGAADGEAWLDIKRHYPLGYEMAAYAVEMIKEQYGYQMDEQERGYLTLHFQAAIEKLKKVEDRIKTVIVCHFGMAACHLISRRIERFFPQIEIVNTYSVQEYILDNEMACDLIISTESLPEVGKPILYVTPALKEVELEQIREFVKTRNSKYLITEQLAHAEIFHFNEPCCKEEILETMVHKLEAQGYVDKLYLDSIYKREAIASTAMRHIAVPHGNPMYVNQFKIAIARISPYVVWDGEEKVKFVFLLVVNGDLLKQKPRVFTNFYKKISDLEFEVNFNELENMEDQSFKECLIKVFKSY